jgi:hypothetical protein
VVVSPDAFEDSLRDAVPPQDVSPPLAALWWAAKGDWDKAHAITQDDGSTDAAWVHAYLHRVEGDLGNASYWYRRAGQPVASNALDAEWTGIVAALTQG